jgi:hypothetical protein
VPAWPDSHWAWRSIASPSQSLVLSRSPVMKIAG